MGKRSIYKLILLCTGLVLNATCIAQEKIDSLVQQNQAEDVMRSNDKIYVVMAVCITILVALFVYLIRIDSKVTKLEKGQ